MGLGLLIVDTLDSIFTEKDINTNFGLKKELILANLAAR